MPSEAPRQRIKILLVDDNPDNLFSLNAVLEPLDEEILCANSGEEALRLCLDHDFAAILMDVRMPRLDGFETAELIRARKSSHHTPILFLTAYRSDEQLFRGYDLGAVDFLFRPVVPEIVQSKVRVFVELSRNAELLRRRAAELERAEHKFRALLEAAPDSKVITRPDGEILIVNSRTEALFGYRREELVGRNARVLIPGWNVDAGTVDVDSGERVSRVVRLPAVRSDGMEFPVEISSSHLQTAEGILFTNSIRDVSEHVRAEESIRRTNVELEKRVAERTTELMRSNEALRQFAWAASHDLQEPLRMVISFSDLLKQSCEEKLDERERHFLSIVDENSARMENLLSALRQYMQISDSDCDDPEPADCNRILDNALQNLGGVISESGATIVRDALPTISCPAVLILQLFQNLIGNAVKYRREEEPARIHIAAERTKAEWIFSVEDNGIGIEPQFLEEYVFGVFKRIHPNRYAGTGIGLAICKAAVERLGGRIWAESQLGRGSKFYFSVPGGAV